MASRFYRLEERELHTAPLPYAWSLGALFGSAAGFAAGLWETALLQAARAPIDLGPHLWSTAAVGAVCGLLAGLTGTYGPRWASATGVMAVAWVASAELADLVARGDAPPAVGVGFAVVLGFGAAQVTGRMPAPSSLHQAAGALGFVLVAVLAPLYHHLIPSAYTAAAIAAGLVVLLVGIALASVAAVLAWERRAPWLPLGGALAIGLGLHGALAARGPPPPAGSEAAVPPVLLVVVSGLRADRVGFLGYEQPRLHRSITPELDRLAQRSVVFEQAHATSNWTVPSLGSMLTGKGPYGHGAGLNNGRGPVDTPLRADLRTVPEILQTAGIGTAAFVADPRLRAYGFDRGFDRYSDDPGHGYLPTALAPLSALGLESSRWPARADADLVGDRAIALVRNLPPNGWFVLVQLGDLAGPVTALPSDEEEVGYTTRPFPSDAYDAALSRVDRVIGRLIEAAPPGAWVVVVGDRGLALGEDRHEARSAVLGVRFGGTMFEELLHVPLVLRPPSSGRPVRESVAVSVVDVAPTVLRLMGVQAPPELDGAPLGPVFGQPQEERVLIAQSTLFGPEQQAVLAGRRKLIQYADDHSPLFDLELDPSESSPIAPTEQPQRGFERRLLSVLPPPGSGYKHVPQPALSLQLGQIANRFLEGDR